MKSVSITIVFAFGFAFPFPFPTRLWPYYITIYYQICAPMNPLPMNHTSNRTFDTVFKWNFVFNAIEYAAQIIDDSTYVLMIYMGFFFFLVGGKFDCKEEGYFADSKNCTKFYRCVKGESKKLTVYEFNCGPGTVFSTIHNNCVYASDSGRPECAENSQNEISGSNEVNNQNQGGSSGNILF